MELEDVEEQAMKPLPQAGRRPMETVVPRSENEQELLTWVQGVVQGSGSGSGTGGSKGRQQGQFPNLFPRQNKDIRRHKIPDHRRCPFGQESQP